VCASDLDRVFHSFGAGVEQRTALLVVARRQLVELLADGNVALVRSDHEAGVCKLLDLILYGGHHSRGVVADGPSGNTGSEIDQAIAVDVDNHAAAGFHSKHRHRCAYASGDGT